MTEGWRGNDGGLAWEFDIGLTETPPWRHGGVSLFLPGLSLHRMGGAGGLATLRCDTVAEVDPDALAYIQVVVAFKDVEPAADRIPGV